MNEQLGETAGLVWRYLKENGETTIPKLTKNLNLDEFLVGAALGWLAREDKIDLYVKGRSKAAKLK